MTTYNNLKLDHQLCFALYAATHAVTRAYRNALEATGLTYTQYLTLLVLWESDGLTVCDIANRLDLDSATLTPILKRLESSGFLTRTRKPEDQRVVEIRLTAAGNALQHQVAKIQHEVECQTGLDEHEFSQLRASLYHLLDTMKNPSEAKKAA